MRSARSPNTALKYVASAQKLIEFCTTRGLSMSALPPNTLSLFSEYLVSQELKPRSVAVYVAGARRFLAWAIDKGVAVMPRGASKVDLPKIVNEPPNSLRSDDLLRFLGFVSKNPEPLRSAILLMPFCGLRTDEMITLRIDEISRINVPLQSGGTTGYLCFTKRGKGGDIRIVPVLADGAPLLISYLQNWRRRLSVKSDWLFANPNGEHVSDRTLRSYVEHAKASMGTTSKLTPHTLRRTYLTALWKAGVDIPTLTKIAGHKSVQTTYQHYLDISAEDVVGAVASRQVSLIPKGAYANQVHAAGAAVGQFLKGHGE